MFYISVVGERVIVYVLCISLFAENSINFWMFYFCSQVGNSHGSDTLWILKAKYLNSLFQFSLIKCLFLKNFIYWEIC